jgi:leader peptidase (prepilin peptidase)/N-methyltransferase
MEFNAMFHAENWARVPFHFWSAILFVFGCMVGSFLNVCIHRMPLGQSVVSPPSHCPHCNYSIPWYLNVPLVTWLYLGGKCANCKAAITVRYFLVELLTGVTFLGCWLMIGRQSPPVALVYCVFLAGLIAATFIDFEHFIIPDEITIGGIVAGFVFSFLVPALHGAATATTSLKRGAVGILVGGGVIYFIVRVGKLLHGQQKIKLEGPSKIVFTETAMVLPDESIPYEELFYRKTDVIKLEASRLELSDRCYRDVAVRLTPARLLIGEEELKPEDVPYMQAITDGLSLPREVMGLGDVKFMAAIGGFLGWQAVFFSLMVSSVIGSLVGISLVALGKREMSSRLPYGPYIAAAATFWIFGGRGLWDWFLTVR